MLAFSDALPCPLPTVAPAGAGAVFRACCIGWCLSAASVTLLVELRAAHLSIIFAGAAEPIEL